MKYLTAVFCATMLMLIASAQDKLPAFGKVEKPDLEMKVCDFDPDGEALYLIDLGEVQYNMNIGAIYIQTDFRYRIKILKENGIDEANIKFHYRSKDRYEEISNIAGFTYNLDESGNTVTTKLEKSQIFDKKYDENFSEISFALPNVKVGSVIEYRYRSYKKSIGNIDDWYFQKDVPTRYSAYNLLIPEYFEFTYQVTRRQDIEMKKGAELNSGNWYIMRNIPALRDEPYIAGKKDYYQRIDFQLSAIHPPNESTIQVRSSWPKLTEELLEDESFGGQLNRNIPKTADLDAMLKLAKTQTEKVRMIYSYVQKNMEWNGNHGIWSNIGIKSAWDKKSGSVPDINLLLINLLKDAGIKALPLLVSTKDNGRLNTTYPFLQQFDEVLAYAEADNTPYIMNAADKYNCYKLIPYDVQQTEGFLVEKSNPRWINLGDLTQRLKHIITLNIFVEDDGKLTGETMVSSVGYGRNIRMNTYKAGHMKEVYETSDGINIKMDSVLVNNVDNDTLPLEQKVHFSGSLQSSGEYAFLPYNLFTGMKKNLFVAEKRETDIDFNYTQYYTIQGVYSIPESFEFEDLPKNLKMIMPDTSIVLTRILQGNGNMVSFRITIDFKRPLYSAEEYPDVKEFYKRLFAILDERIVIKKKKA